jgi:hypothetical protein
LSIALRTERFVLQSVQTGYKATLIDPFTGV